MEKYTIKEHIAKKHAIQCAKDICNANNGETLYQQETMDFVDLFEKELLAQMGYEEETKTIKASALARSMGIPFTQL